MIDVVGVSVEGGIVLAPLLQDRIGCNGRVKHPLGNADSLVGSAYPPCAEPTVTVEDVAIDLITRQVLLCNRP